jgi:hypothetical protein
MEKEELRPLVLHVLRRESQTHFNAIEHQVKALAPAYGRQDALRLQEVLWELLLQGVLAPGKNSSNLHLPFLHVTEYGARCLEEDSLLLHDPDGYLARLEGRLGRPLDPVLLSYVRESVESFLCGRYLGALVTLGLAGERLLDLLVDALAKGIADRRERGALKRGVNGAGRSVERRFDVLRIYLERLSLPRALAEGLRIDLPGLVALSRHSRDEEGLPIERPSDRETAHASLLSFPGHCAWAFALIDYLRKAQEA